jgi:hypothetical protein
LTDFRIAKRIAAFACLLSLPVGLAFAQDRIYRCVAPDGKVSFQAQACSNTVPSARTDAPQAVQLSLAVPPARSSSDRPAPRDIKPAASAPENKPWASGADVIVVSGYEPSTSPIQVNVSHTVRPVMLVLTSYKGIKWKVQGSPGTRIKVVVVAGSVDGGRSSVEAPPQVPVLDDQLPYAYESGNIKFRELMSMLNSRYGVERVLGYRGAYKLPSPILVNGPFPPDKNLTLDGVRPEVPGLRFDFDLVSEDGRRLPFTNTGPKGTNRYTGIVRGGTLGSRAGPAVVSEDGREAYYLEGNGGSLIWAPEGVSGRKEKLIIPAGMPALSWGSGLAWDTRKGILFLVSFGGEGFLYRYDTRNHKWLDSHSLQNRDLISAAINPSTGDVVAISDKAELVRFNGQGLLEEVTPLGKLLADLDSTYDKGNEGLKNLSVAAVGTGVAVANVRNGTVTHIWTYDQRSRKAQLTYKAIE